MFGRVRRLIWCLKDPPLFIVFVALSNPIFADEGEVLLPDTEFVETVFLYEGAPIGPENRYLSDDQVNAFEIALGKFPSASACLENGRNGDQNELVFDWDSIELLEEAEVCIFFVSQQIGQAESISDWLLQAGFEVVQIGNGRVAEIETQQRTNGTVIAAAWRHQFDKFGRPLPFGVRSDHEGLVGNLSLIISLGDNGRLVSTRMRLLFQ